jgi:hypothetical protein
MINNADDDKCSKGRGIRILPEWRRLAALSPLKRDSGLEGVGEI